MGLLSTSWTGDLLDVFPPSHTPTLPHLHPMISPPPITCILFFQHLCGRPRPRLAAKLRSVMVPMHNNDRTDQTCTPLLCPWMRGTGVFASMGVNSVLGQPNQVRLAQWKIGTLSTYTIWQAIIEPAGESAGICPPVFGKSILMQGNQLKPNRIARHC